MDTVVDLVGDFESQADDAAEVDAAEADDAPVVEVEDKTVDDAPAAKRPCLEVTRPAGAMFDTSMDINPTEIELLLPGGTYTKHHISFASGTRIPLCRPVGMTPFGPSCAITKSLSSMTRGMCDSCFERLSEASKALVVDALEAASIVPHRPRAFEHPLRPQA